MAVNHPVLACNIFGSSTYICKHGEPTYVEPTSLASIYSADVTTGNQCDLIVQIFASKEFSKQKFAQIFA
jgi:hypothetical protein